MKRYETPNFNYHHLTTDNPFSLSILDHIHPQYEFLYFLNGEADYVINSSVYNLKKRDFLLIHPGTFHHLIPKSNMQYERICIHFYPSAIPKAFKNSIKNFKSVYHIHKYSAIDNIFSTLLNSEYEKHYSEADITYLVAQYFGIILTHLKYLQEETELLPYETNDLINNVLTFIDDNIEAPLNVHILSKKFFRSPSTLAHYFSSSMHFSLQQYITSKKIIHAQTLIQQGTPPTAVATQLSFKDYSSFFKCYKRVLGHTPSHDQPEHK